MKKDNPGNMVLSAESAFRSLAAVEQVSIVPAAVQSTITVSRGELASNADQAEKVLVEAGVEIYQRGGELVRPIIETVEAARSRKTKSVQFLPVSQVYLRDIMGRHARWERFDARKRECITIDAPKEIAEIILAKAGEWQFRSIVGVTTTPTIRPDGSLLTDCGYDAATRLLLVEPPALGAMPDIPTKEDARGALATLESLLDNFPFVGAVDKACALSALLTTVARGAFSVTPMHCSRAPTPGTGKSFLWDVCSVLCTGQLMPVISTGGSPAELEKRLGAALMKGQPVISIDNVNGELGGDALCQFIERPVVDVRVLGLSKMVRIESRNSIFATGNNLVLRGDACRRALMVNLDSGLERPELRQYAFDPVERVMADRGKYIAAALTICRAYFLAGKPGALPKLASFEGWSHTVRSAIVWLGHADPCTSMESARAEDPLLIELREMLEAWAVVFGTGEYTRLKVKDLLLKATATVRASESGEFEATHPELASAVEGIALRFSRGRSKQIDPKSLGDWLRGVRGKPAGGMKFQCVPSRKGGNEWFVEQV